MMTDSLLLILLHGAVFASALIVVAAARFSARLLSSSDRGTTPASRPGFLTGEALAVSFANSLRSAGKLQPVLNAGLAQSYAVCWPGRTLMPSRTSSLGASRLCAAGLVVVSVGASAFAADGTQWTSFQNGGQPVAEVAMPTRWSPETNIAWEAEIEGYGQSTPLTMGGTIVVTSTSGENKEKYHVSGFRLSDGELLWQNDFDNPTPEKNSSYVSRAAPTPVVDGDKCFAFFEGGLLVACSSDGKELWKHDLVAKYGAISARHGLASSLEQDASNIFVWIERGEDPYLLAVSKESGETVWKSPGLGSTSWSSPRLIEVGDGQQLVCSSSGKVAAFDPATGERLWTFEDISNNTSCTPAPAGPGRFFIGASDGRGEENAGKGSTSNVLMEIVAGDDGKWLPRVVLHAKRATASFGSPVVHGNSAYIVNRQGVLYRLDLQTGEEDRPKRLGCGGIWATPLVANNQLYLLGSKGTTSVVDLATGEEVEENQLWNPPKSAEEGQQAAGGSVLYAAAVASPYLLLRTGDRLYAIQSGVDK